MLVKLRNMATQRTGSNVAAYFPLPANETLPRS